MQQKFKSLTILKGHRKDVCG